MTCTLTSTFPAPVTYFNVTMIYRNAQGAIIGGDVEGGDIDRIDLVVPPGPPIEVTLLDLASGVPVAECHPNYEPPLGY